MKIELPNLEKCTIAVIGIGYVGLPVAIEFARRKKSVKNNINLDRKIIGFDIDKKRINQLRNNIDITKEIDFNEHKNLENLVFTSDEKSLNNADFFILTVPTPIDNSNKPDLTYLEKACETVGRAIKNKPKHKLPIVIFESTVYPGATEEICIPIISKLSNLSIYLKQGDNNCFGYGYSPERINPGDKEHRISSIKKVTSGNNKEIAFIVNELYGSIIEAGTFMAKSIKVAEAAKVIENTQRDLNIALMNELSIIFSKLNIDTLDVIEAAKTKWNFIPFTPGLVGGHCIGIDPYYLTYKSKQIGYTPEIILAGRKINDNMAYWHCDQLISKLSKIREKDSNLKGLILGFTFKENCPDIRNTKVLDLINSLKNKNMKYDIVDPCANIEETFKVYKVILKNKISFENKYDFIVVTVAHNNFKKLSYACWESLCQDETLIIDLKGIVPRTLNPIRP